MMSQSDRSQAGVGEGHKPLRLGVLISGSGRTMVNIAQEIEGGRLNAEIAVVIGSKAGLVGLERAQETGLKNIAVDRRDFTSRQAYSERIFALLDESAVDLVVLAGWLCLLTVPQRYIGRVMNIHPSLLPSFGGKGMYGDKVHQAVLDYGCKVSGCTVHFADNSYDTGPIILQRCCEVVDGDTAHSLAARVFEQELIAYPQAIGLFGAGRLEISGRCVKVSK